MALQKDTRIDKIEILTEISTVQVREATVITDDGVEVSRSNHRHTIGPEDDYSNEPDEVKAAVAAVRNPGLIAQYLAAIS